MDGDRRRKTVIAGTFAIDRKSLSNAQPISPVGSRCTTVFSMTLPSTNARSISDRPPAQKGFTRALSQHLQHSWKDRAGGALAIAGPAIGDRPGKIGRSNGLLAFADRCRSFFLFQNHRHQIFLSDARATIIEVRNGTKDSPRSPAEAAAIAADQAVCTTSASRAAAQPIRQRARGRDGAHRGESARYRSAPNALTHAEFFA
jgi:hypothetical protein